MSGTAAPTASGSPATQATAAGSYIAASAVTTILVWFLGLHGIQVPDQVGLAVGTLLGAGIHWVAIWSISRNAAAPTVSSPILTPHL